MPCGFVTYCLEGKYNLVDETFHNNGGSIGDISDLLNFTKNDSSSFSI